MVKDGDSMKKIICMVMMLLVIPFVCQAHYVYGYNPQRTNEAIKMVEDYFKKNYNLVLKKKLTFYVTTNTRQYRAYLQMGNMPNADELAEATQAMTSGSDAIIINSEMMPNDLFRFVLAHEMVHQYQLENYSDPYSDMVMMEGKADLIASEISKYKIEDVDFGIPYEALKTKDGYEKEALKNPKGVLRQVRFYAKQIPGFFPKQELAPAA